ncbi:MAG: hypothetical protein KQH83_03175 [Actinobacteria bacterium]|nr:hypothetical protein [Actinomycetota bacterium]
MIRQVIRGATLRRDAYLRAVIGTNGTADAVLIVGAVYLALSFTISTRGVADVLGHGRFLLNGAFAWLAVSGIVYLVARYGLHGEGSFQGVLAMSALAHPPLLLLIAAQAGTAVPLRFVAHPTLLMLEAWRFDALTAGLVILADLWFVVILAAGTRVAMSLSLDKAVMSAGAAYGAWWVVGSIFRF